MKPKKTALIVAGIIATLPLGAATVQEKITNAAKQKATRIKLDATGVYFGINGWRNSRTYLAHWQDKTGESRTYPSSDLSNDVWQFLSKQRNDITSAVQNGIKSGKYKQGTKMRVPATLTAMPRPATRADFTYAIGGCTVLSSAEVSIGQADAKGVTKCTIDSWTSMLSDIYKFDKSDVFSFKGIAVFVAGELYNYEQVGLAKQFTVTLPEFSKASMLGPFNVTVKIKK